jgi:hypothetical protein
LSKLSVDSLLLFNECMQCFLNISSRRWSIRRCISMRILEIMVCLKWWLWSLCIIVITQCLEQILIYHSFSILVPRLF